MPCGTRPPGHCSDPVASSVPFDPAFFTTPAFVITLIAAIVAGLVRGFTGFGAALIFVPVASAAYGPNVAAPTLLIIDFVLTFRSSSAPCAPLPLARRCCRRRLPRMVATPFGAWALAAGDPTALRWAISAGHPCCSSRCSPLAGATGPNPRLPLSAGGRRRGRIPRRLRADQRRHRSSLCGSAVRIHLPIIRANMFVFFALSRWRPSPPISSTASSRGGAASGGGGGAGLCGRPLCRLPRLWTNRRGWLPAARLCRHCAGGDC